MNEKVSDKGCKGSGQRHGNDPSDEDAGECFPLDTGGAGADEADADDGADRAVRRAYRNAELAR